MIPEQQIGINHAALRRAADRLEREGFQGDSFRFIESLVLSVLADGYQVIEKPPPLRATAELGGPGHREFQAAKEALKRSKG